MGFNKQLSELCRSIATMLDAGVNVRRALTVSAQKCSSKRLSDAIIQCEAEVGAGNNLHTALSRQKHIPPLITRLASVGEKTGHLHSVFFELANFYELKTRLWRRFLQAITIPALQYVLAVFVLSLAHYIFNMIRDDTGGVAFIPLLGYGIPLAVIIAGKLLNRFASGTRFCHEILWRTPLLSHVTRPLAITRFSMCFKFSLEAGMHIKESLQTAFEASANEVFKAGCPIAVKTVENGESITSALDNTRLFDNEYIEVVSVAEESGKIVERMQWLTEHYREKTTTALTILSSVFGKLIWITVAVFILYFIFNIFSTYIHQITNIV